MNHASPQTHAPGLDDWAGGADPGWASRFYSIFLVWLPVLALYAPPGVPIHLAEIILILFSVLAVLRLVERVKQGVQSHRVSLASMSPLFLATALLAITCAAVFLIDRPTSPLHLGFRTAKVAIWAFAISVTSRELLHAATLFRTLRVVSLLSLAYLGMQVAGWRLAGVILPSVILNPVLPPTQESYVALDQLRDHYQNFFYRPASFFGEPAYLAYFSFVVLISFLFIMPPRTWRDLALPVAVTLGVVLSTSTSGLYIAILIWMAWGASAATRSSTGKHVLAFTLVFGPLLVGLAVLVAPRDIRLWSTIQDVASKPVEQWSSSVRLGGSYSLVSELDGFQILTGVGLGNEDAYFGLEDRFYNDVALLALSGGLLAILAFIGYAAALLLGTKGGGRMLVWVYLGICLFEQHLYSAASILILSVALYGAPFLTPSDNDEAESHRRIRAGQAALS